MGVSNSFAQNNVTGSRSDIIDADLLKEIENANEKDANFKFIVYLDDQIALDFDQLSADVDTRRGQIVRSLQFQAEASQQSVIHEIDGMMAQNQIKAFQPFWIFNGIAAEGSAEAIFLLAEDTKISRIALDKEIEPIHPIKELSLDTSEAHTQTWGTKFINAPHVWHGLGVTGTGVTVAIMDTGVDFEHPILNGNYRGNLGDGNYQHAGNWFHAAVPTHTTPVDFQGHGTHVAGTAVGSRGIGVAPGADWIAVSVADEEGLFYQSSVHSSFEWLLAPNDDPSLAPDIINGSWGGPGIFDTFLEDVNLLKQAGIIPVFSAGNNGPYTYTVGSPGSYTNTIAVASISPDGSTSWFSSRGPSFLHAGVSPIIAAPGGTVYSSLPGNDFGTFSGTSMAAPHVSGGLALLLSVNDTINNNSAALSLLSESAIPYEHPHPNVNSGYGRLDAHEQIQEFVPELVQLSGILQSQGIPIPNQPITITNESGSFTVYTDIDGQYSAALQRGSYNLMVSKFGYNDYTSGQLYVTSDKTFLNLNLTRQPHGTLTGSVTADNQPIANATIIVKPINLEFETDVNGDYDFELPVGSYELLVNKSGFKLVTQNIQVNNQPSTQNFVLEPTESILLIDAGAWSFRSREAYYQDAFIEMEKGWDTFQILNPVFGKPDQDLVNSYDVVIWSDPRYSPGYIDASLLISNYASSGGNLLISGARIANYDFEDPFIIDWIEEIAFAEPTRLITVTDPIIGHDDTTFAGYRALLNGHNSSDDQDPITAMQPKHPAKSDVILSHADPYTNTNGVGIQAGHCEQYNTVYLGFDLSAVQGAENRAKLINDSIEWFNQPEQETGVMWLSNDVDIPIVSGESYGYQVRFYNQSETMTRTFNISTESGWATTILTSSLSIGPCQVGSTTVTVTVPAGLPKNTANQTAVSIQDSQDSSASDLMLINHKTPGTLLLVEDYRWFEQSDLYQPAINELNIDYDVWTNDHIFNLSPSQSLLNEYKYIVWYTAYDWFDPISKVEIELIESYLENGGRLFLNSQDFNYYHSNSKLASQYFEIGNFSESVTPTVAYGGSLVQGNNHAGSVSISFDEYNNHADSLFLHPEGSATPLLWHDRGLGGIGNSGQDHENDWRVVFWSVPFETLERSAQAQVMANTVGWLSDLGESSLTTENDYVDPGQSQIFSITIKNRSKGITQSASFTNPLPSNLDYMPNSATNGLIWDSTNKTFSWSGTILPGESFVFTYEATFQAAGRYLNEVFVQSDAEPFQFHRGTAVQVGGVNYSQSQTQADVSPIINGGRQITVMVNLLNVGDSAANNITATAYVPDELNYVTKTLTTVSGQAIISNSSIIWTGSLPTNVPVSISAVYTSPYIYIDDWVPSSLTIEDENGPGWFDHQAQFIEGIKNWLPILSQK
ncbi:MAG: S8 family serine peptidase [Chloroflexota bacterium]